jgi:hypothetical protein
VAAGKKNAARLGAHLVFADESGFLLAPLVAKNLGPQGCTPLQRHRQGRRDKVSVISGISVSPRRQRIWACTINSISTTSGKKKFACFYASCCATCGARDRGLLDNSSTHQGSPSGKTAAINIARLHIEHFPAPMLRSSTPMKEFGRWRNERSPIVAQMMWRSWLRT